MESYNTFLLLMIVLTILWLVWVPLVNYGRNRKPPVQTRKWETYGHAYPPVPELHKRLPEPPENHAWEIRTAKEGKGVSLILSLLDLRTGTPLCSYTRDASYRSATGTSWSEAYRGFVSKPYLDSVFAEFIDPFLRWAEAQKVEHSPPGGEYLLRGPK